MVVNCKDVWRASSDYIDGELGEEMSLAIERHLEICQRCMAVVMGTRNIVEILASNELFDVPEGYGERLRARLESVMDGRTRARSVWLATAVASGLLAAAGLLIVQVNPGTESLRAPMSQPARQLPEKLVAVSDEGKTFHTAVCPLLHGKWHLMEAKEAIRRGYNPCTRCMKEALQTTRGAVIQVSEPDEETEESN